MGSEARDILLTGERPLSTLQRHPSRPVRLAACHALFALVLAFPNRLAPLLEHALQQLMSAHAIAEQQPKEREKALDAVQVASSPARSTTLPSPSHPVAEARAPPPRTPP